MPSQFFAELADRLCLVLLHSLWQSALLALVAVAAARWLHRGRVEAAYRWHAAALVGCLALVLVTFWALPYPQLETPAPAMWQVKSIEPVGESQWPLGLIPTTPENVAKPQAANVIVEPMPALVTNKWWRQFAPYIAALYLLGVAVMFARLLRGLVATERLRRTASPIPNSPASATLRDLAHRFQLRTAPLLAETSRTIVPTVVGFTKPMVLLPTSALTGLAPAELELILAHELAHLRRGDLWMQLVQRLAEAVLFFNPALWYLSRRVGALREECCDNAACGLAGEPTETIRLTYATALVRVVELVNPSLRQQAATVSLAATGRGPSELRRRIARLVGEPVREPVRVSRGGLYTIALLAILLTALPSLNKTAAESPEVEKKEIAEQSSSRATQETYLATFTVIGRALNPAGEAIANAEIYLAASSPGSERLGTKTTDAEGRYRFENVSLPIEKANANNRHDWGGFEVFGFAKGYAIAWEPQKFFRPDIAHVDDVKWHLHRYREKLGLLPFQYGSADPIEINLRFAEPTTLRGRVVDDAGKPLAGTPVDLRRCESIDEWVEVDGNSIRIDSTLNSLNEREVVPLSFKTRVTDETGRFDFTDLPAGFRWYMDVKPQGRTMKSVSIETTTPRGTQPPSELEVAFPKPRQVQFQVIYSDTGQPAEKVGVGGMVDKAGFWQTTTADGMVSVPLADGDYVIETNPRYLTNYLPTEHNVTISATTAQQPIKLKLDPAALVKVKVIDAETKAPLQGVDVWWDEPIKGKTDTYRNARLWRSWEVETGISHVEAPRTDAQGVTTVNFPPGKHRIGVGLDAFPKGYEPVENDGKLIDCQPGKPAEVEFELRKKKS